MPVGTLRPLAVVCFVLLLSTITTDGLFGGSNTADANAPPINTDPPSGAQPLLKFRVGDRFVYVNETYGLRWTLTVHEPVMAAAANLTKVRALPIVLNVTAPGIQGWEAYAMDLATGDLVVAPEACLVDARLSCGAYAGFRWSCPLDGMLGVASYVTMADLDQSVVVLEDPRTGWRFPYTVERNEETVRFTLRADEATGAKIVCAQRPAVTVDLDAGIVTAMTVRPHVGGVDLTLADWTPGEGPTFSFAGEPSRASILLPPEMPRRDIYPPGYGQVGPPQWTLGEAVARARLGHAPFTRWLEEHPDAFLYEARLSPSWSETLGVLRSETFRWTLDVLSPQREMVRLVAEKKIVQGLVKLVEFDMEEVAVPDHVPPLPRPPSKTGVHVQAFLDEMAGHGYYPDKDELVNPILETGFDETGGGAFSYFLIIDTEEIEPGASLLIGFTFVSDTGRLGGGSLPLERARELLS